MSPRAITFTVICGLSGLTFGISEQAILPCLLGGLAFGLTFSVCVQLACESS